MGNNKSINCEITHMKELLEITARQYEYNFKHPKVLSISQKLDGLIIKKMKKTMPDDPYIWRR